MTFSAPLTFYDAACLSENQSKDSGEFNAIEATLLGSKPSALKAWGRGGDADANGVVVGCEDGSLYLFSTPRAESTEPPSPEKRRRRPRSPVHLHRRSRPSSPLPTSLPISPAFNVARVASVSGITAEQVEAPRNYVDFEDEPERLKDILKGKNPKERERVSFETASLVTISPAPSVVIEPVPASKRSKGGSPKSFLSTINSPETRSSQCSSSLPSPKEKQSDFANLLTLQSHIVPTNTGYGNAIRSIEILEDNNLMVALQESGHLSVYSLNDGSCFTTVFAPSYSSIPPSRDVWTWASLRSAVVDETSVLLVTAATDSNTSAATPDKDENSTEKSQTIALQLSRGPNTISLDKLAAWVFEGPAHGIGIFRESDNSSTLFSISSEGHFLVRRIAVQQPPIEALSPSAPASDTDSIRHLAIPKSLKSIVSRSSETLALPQTTSTPGIQATIQESLDVGNLISDSTVSGLSTRTLDEKLLGIVWAHRELIIFEYHAHALRKLLQIKVSYLEDVEWLDNESYALSFPDRIEIYKLQSVNADNDHADPASGDPRYSPILLRQIPTDSHDACAFSSSTKLILFNFSETNRRQIVSYNVLVNGHDTTRPEQPFILWQSGLRKRDITSAPLQTSSIPLDFDTIVLGYSDGRLRQYSLQQLAFKNEGTSSVASALKQSEPAVPGSIVGLHCAQNLRTKDKYLVGGADDGSILMWNITTFELCARWIIFSTPMVKMVEFQDNTGPLRGCVLCIAQDGTIAVIAVDGFQFLYLVPGSPSPLTRISLGGSNLVLIYGNSIARLWDVQTKEFWRSMAVDKAEEMFSQGGWRALDVSGVDVSPSQWSTIAPAFSGTDAAATLDLYLDKVVTDCISITKTISTSRDEVRNILQALERLRLLLSIFITPGLNSDVDSICTGKLKLRTSSVSVGFTSCATTTLYPVNGSQHVWSISGDVSAARMLALVFILRAMALFEELSEAANTAIAFYTLSLPACVGSQYVPPSLEWLGQRWFSAAPDLRAAMRVVFEATLAHIGDQEAMNLAEKWQQHLPSLQPQASRESEIAALAFLICGAIAAEKFNLLSVNALSEITKSLTLYLHDEDSTHRALAIDICSKGFHVWQRYIDAMEILRALFSLATSVRKESISVQNVAAQARAAVLNLATNHTTLFMSTLCLDVLNPPSLEHRRCVMQIIAFLIRKRRHILQPNLPRLMEAVVKSLDPNSNANREAVLDTATEIIGFVVKHFPTVDFHMNTQRLAVGTSEGAVVMYDVKTAIRLYVLEGHKRQLAACSFSPDGRRLVTVSLVEQTVLVWKVGSSFSSFFNPGAPPRQGHSGSEPFKTLQFHIGNEAQMTAEETLDLVKFEWVADRSVKVKIRDTILTFST